MRLLISKPFIIKQENNMKYEIEAVNVITILKIILYIPPIIIYLRWETKKKKIRLNNLGLNTLD